MRYPQSLVPCLELEKKVRGILRYNEPLSLHTTFRLGGPADVLIIPSCVEEVLEISDLAFQYHIPLYVIGMGSNLLIADEGLRGIVLKISSPLDELSYAEDTVIAGAGIKCARLIASCLKLDFQGLSFLSGIPGTLGGAIAMNAGTSGLAIGDLLRSAYVYDREKKESVILEQADFNFSYRNSIVKQSERFIILQAVLNINQGSSHQEILSIRSKLLKRKQSQPWQYPNAGCIWKNPPGYIVGKMIEELGMKGLKCGRAQISELHGNFIVHDGKASADHVYHLICHVEEVVFRSLGIRLEREIKILGQFRV
jgi:UDP-N-acetylmuramate dehydrogenase